MDTFLKFLVWIAFNLVGCLFGKLVTRKIYCTRIAENPWFSWINFKTNPISGKKYFKITCYQMTPYDRTCYWICSMHMVLIMFYYGNVHNKMNHLYDFWYLLGYLIIPIFGFLGETKALIHFTITPHHIRNLSPAGKVALGMLVSSGLALYVYHCYLAYLEEMLLYYLIGTCCAPMFYTVLYKYWLEVQDSRNTIADDPKPTWHIHHYFVGYYFALLFRFDTVISKLAFIVFYMVFLEGTVVEGTPTIIV